MTESTLKKPTQSLEKTLRRQLFIGLSIVLLTLLIIVHVSTQQLTKTIIAEKLQNEADSLVAAMTLTENGLWQVDETRMASVYQRAYSGHYYRVQVGEQTFNSRSVWDIDLNNIEHESSTPTAELGHFDGPNGQECTVLKVRIFKGGYTFQVWVAEDTLALRALQIKLELGLLALISLSIPLLLWLQKTIITRNFAVFADIHQAVSALHRGDDLVFPTDIPYEVTDLVSEIERTLLRSSKQLQRSRTAVGNLAHELKRPLQNLRWLAEHSDGKQKDELLALYEHLQTLITRELRRAAISGSPTPGKRFNPKEDLPVLETLLGRQHRQSIQLNMNLPEATLPFDRDDMLELLGNLLDNAWRYAQSRIDLHIRQPNAEHWYILLEDDGEGLSQSDAQALSERGVTRDESDNNHQGLGLHICQAVVESYDGTMTMGRAKIGGLAVLIVLPNDA